MICFQLNDDLRGMFSTILNVFITNVAIGTILSTTNTNDDP
jgi:hypothetical protein